MRSKTPHRVRSRSQRSTPTPAAAEPASAPPAAWRTSQGLRPAPMPLAIGQNAGWALPDGGTALTHVPGSATPSRRSPLHAGVGLSSPPIACAALFRVCASDRAIAESVLIQTHLRETTPQSLSMCDASAEAPRPEPRAAATGGAAAPRRAATAARAAGGARARVPLRDLGAGAVEEGAARAGRGGRRGVPDDTTLAMLHGCRFGGLASAPCAKAGARHMHFRALVPLSGGARAASWIGNATRPGPPPCNMCQAVPGVDK